MIFKNLSLIICAFVIAFMFATSACVAASNDVAPVVFDAVNQGGLSCFTINPPSYDKDNPTSCDKLCGAKGMACTGVTSSVNPPQSCSSAIAFATCRCCKIDGGKQ